MTALRLLAAPEEPSRDLGPVVVADMALRGRRDLAVVNAASLGLTYLDVRVLWDADLLTVEQAQALEDLVRLQHLPAWGLA